MTGKEICEHIAKANFLFKEGTDIPLTADEIWNYSPTGELFMLHEWYENACKILNFRLEDETEHI